MYDKQRRTTIKKSFGTIRQGNATNTLTKITTRKGDVSVDQFTGDATITYGDMTVRINKIEESAGLRISTYQLLDALTEKLTESGARTPEVNLSIDEYMKKRDLRDRKEARRQVDEDLQTLFSVQISFRENSKGKKEQDYHDMRLIESKGIRKGMINVSFGATFFNLLKLYPIMPYPTQLWWLNNRKNPNSFFFLRKIAEIKNMNRGKSNDDIIAVRTLLGATPMIPSYEDVMKGSRHVKRKIIEPFERDMDALSDTLTWEYCHSKGVPLTDDELADMSYERFKDLLVKVHWNLYPERKAKKGG